MRLEGKVAVVTGGGSGIGEAIAVRLANEGARVAVLDIGKSAAALAADLCGGIPLVADVSKSGEVDAALATAEAELGPVDIWVNNAGVAGRPEWAKPVNARAEQQIAEMATGAITTPLDALVTMDDEEWRRMIAVHLDGTFYGTRAAARSMVQRRTGAIVNIASICGLIGCTGHPHYSAAKAGIAAFSRTVAKELILQNVRVNSVAPGFIETPLLASGMTDTLNAVTMLATPQGRLGRPEEVAATVAFLASDEASFYVGQNLSPNGGIVTI